MTIIKTPTTISKLESGIVKVVIL